MPQASCPTVGDDQQMEVDIRADSLYAWVLIPVFTAHLFRLKRERKMFLMKCLVPVVVSFSLAACAPLVLVGAGAAVGVLGYKYYQGALTVIYESPYMDTWDATLKALEQMHMKVESSRHDASSGWIVARDPDQKRVSISMEYRSAKETEVVIRAGTMGDEQASLAIKEGIRKELFKD